MHVAIDLGGDLIKHLDFGANSNALPDLARCVQVGLTQYQGDLANGWSSSGSEAFGAGSLRNRQA